MQRTSPNFAFLSAHDPQLALLGALAEHYFQEDPNTCLIKLRQFSELIAQRAAANAGLFVSTNERQADMIQRLRYERILPPEIADLLHTLRQAGNSAVHAMAGEHALALNSIKIARQVGVWFHRTFGDASFTPGPFVPPPDPAAADQALQAELAQLREQAAAARTEAEQAAAAAQAAAEARMTAEERMEREREERQIWEQLATEAEQARFQLAAQLAAAQAAAQAAPQATAAIPKRAAEAAQRLDIDEATTRTLIDAQLVARGWEADTQQIRYSAGARPAKGHNRAIAEWPTASGPADYALFIGMQCVGVIEAKRKNKNVSATIDQAQRYARDFQFAGGAEAVGGPWPNGNNAPYLVPFVFSSNGRPYLRQLETASGIWFRDVRSPTELRRALNDWPTPAGLAGQLDHDKAAATAALRTLPIEFGFPLRPYQRHAIELVETQLAADSRQMLLAMATGTGKTKLAIALLYRLLAAKRFRRICFVVDRTALGEQAAGEFKTTKIVSAKTFADIFDLAELKTAVPEDETKVHICTIQALVKRVLYAQEPADVPPIDQYDLIVVDECHRGYLLDREMSDAELSFRSQDDYVSKYRRVLEHFDAVKIGLTATPALHTVDIFGDPVFTYSYREAVVDGFLVDHEPPLQITTALAQSGITFSSGEEVERFDPQTGEIDLAHLPDEVNFAVDAFNKRVITREFNRVVAAELVRHIDPSMPGKTLVFAATDAHADIVVDELKHAFQDEYGEIHDEAVAKITGRSDDPHALIRSFRNDALPKVAVTVDLLTTGVDVPKIENLVFLRRVNSRILYEQMLGRATRLCPEIEKETFKIFDAVDLYAHLQQLTAMRPVVVDPAISLEQLFDEFAAVDEPAHREAIREQLVVKLRRRINRLDDQARAAFEAAAGETPAAALERLASSPAALGAEWVRERPGLGAILASATGGTAYRLLISHHPDRVMEVRTGYGSGQRPEDFLSGFAEFVRSNINTIAALKLVVQRPRDLTRAALKELRLQLDAQGYSDAVLRRAWADTRNEDIAASIIGFVRQAALGSPLVPFEQRVHAAMRRILASRDWSPVQIKWLGRIETQIIREIVVDTAALDAEPFSNNGGFNWLNKVFGGQISTLLADITEQVWENVA